MGCFINLLSPQSFQWMEYVVRSMSGAGGDVVPVDYVPMWGILQCELLFLVVVPIQYGPLGVR